MTGRVVRRPRSAAAGNRAVRHQRQQRHGLVRGRPRPVIVELATENASAGTGRFIDRRGTVAW
jgi:hypothetical protein